MTSPRLWDHLFHCRCPVCQQGQRSANATQTGKLVTLLWGWNSKYGVIKFNSFASRWLNIRICNVKRDSDKTKNRWLVWVYSQPKILCGNKNDSRRLFCSHKNTRSIENKSFPAPLPAAVSDKFAYLHLQQLGTFGLQKSLMFELIIYRINVLFHPAAAALTREKWHH